jgi:hypothetical protein
MLVDNLDGGDGSSAKLCVVSTTLMTST